jgi:hypothetical protein
MVPAMVSYEDYVAMSAFTAVWGEQQMLAYYKLAPPHFTQIAQHWGSIIPTNPQYAGYAAHVQQEQARLQGGGVPRPIALGPPQQQQPPPNDFDQLGKAFDAFGSAIGSLVVGISVGARVLVTWTDGNRYPGTVTAVNGSQIAVAFQNGQQHWVPSNAITLT